MPVLNLNEGERNLLVTALAHDRARRMHEWEQIQYDNSRINPDGDRWVIDGVVDAITDLRRKIEVVDQAQGSNTAWHHEHGWLPSALHKLAESREFESAGPYGGFGRAEVSSVENVGDQMSPGTWTTLPDDFDANDTLFSCFDGSEYDRIEISVNGAWRNRYRVRKSESDKFLKDLAKVFIDRD
ncbi:hypothetical protein [Agrobacterium sp. LAD9]|uniref:hypothetical protein n=1 Tax=Agrobacterium sp. LAD9 TaxID=2055153 RepID=UPI000D1E0395|nr:hypothetical protein [Agrobacterium sp. LAD9]